MINLKSKFFILIYLVCFQQAFTQNTSKIDSLWAVYTSTKNDSVKTSTANYLSFHYIFKSPPKADSILNQALSLAESSDIKFNLVELTNTRGIYYDVLGQKDSSKVYFEKALKLSRKYNFKRLEVRCINNLGMFNWNTGNFKEALNYFYEALEYSNTYELDSENGQSTYFNNIGLIYQELRQFEEAIKYHNKALNIRLKYNETKDISQSYNNLAICYKSINQLVEAEKYIRLAIEFAEKADQPKMYHQFHDNLGNILNLQGKLKLAEEAYVVALNVGEEYKSNVRDKFITYSNLIDLYNDTYRFEMAKQTIKKADALIKKDPSLYNFTDSYYLNSAKTYFSTGDLEKGNAYYEKYAEVKDSLFSQENANAIADVEAKLKTKEKEAELAKTKNNLLEKELEVKRQNILMYGSIIAFIVLFVLSYFIIRAKKLKNEQLQKEAELKTALAKIELKNKLEEQRLRISRDLHDNIGSQLTFVISGLQYLQYQKGVKINEVKSKLQQLSQFTKQTNHELRDTVWAMNKEEISLIDLMERLRNFINQTTVKEKITLLSPEQKKYSKSIKFNAIEGIQLFRIIQEATNNAIKHAEAKNIKIKTSMDEGLLRIQIIDDGRGFDAGTIEFGNGLNNIKKRAKQIKAKLEIESNTNNGTSISLAFRLTHKNLENGKL